jgi:hypothetical protein
MYEYVGNMHVHSTLSDGTGTYATIGSAANRAGLDFIVITDHNVYTEGLEKYQYHQNHKVLVLTGMEIHDASRTIQKDHLLAYNLRTDPSAHAAQPQGLIQKIQDQGGLSFIAHPLDPAAPAFNEPDLSWESWDIQGYTGIELWNFMSEFKSKLRSKISALFYGLLPERICTEPFPEVVQTWDALLAQGKRIVAIGGSDGHALHAQLGPIQRVIFPYEFGFQTVNTHVLSEHLFTGDLVKDRAILYDAIEAGHCFVANDLPALSTGFRFTAQSDKGVFMMGDQVKMDYGVTLQIRTPLRSEISLFCNGEEIQRWPSSEIVVHTVQQSGVYRVEVYTFYKGRRRSWIYSNPIYVS